MHVNFENLADTSRIWIYVADKPVTGDQRDWMASSLQSFLEKWTAHGNNLKAGFKMFYDQILVIGLDESTAGASGCSIDSSVHFLKGMGAHLEVDFFNRNLIPFLENGKIKLEELNTLKKKIADDEITGESQIFNTSLAKKVDLKNHSISLKDSWLSRYLKNQEIST